MMRSLYSGISGLRNHQTRMDVIGNNISNVNTTGFKSGRVTFADTLSQNLSGAAAPQGGKGGTNPKQIGLGSAVSAIDTLFTDGSPQSTGVNTDLCLSGNGLFIVSGGNQGVYYTRNGNFRFDKQGNYVNADGLFVQGWMGGIPGEDVRVNGLPGKITIPAGKSMPGEKSTVINFTKNLNSEEPTIQGMDLNLTNGDVVTLNKSNTVPYSVQGDYPGDTVDSMKITYVDANGKEITDTSPATGTKYKVGNSYNGGKITKMELTMKTSGDTIEVTNSNNIGYDVGDTYALTKIDSINIEMPDGSKSTKIAGTYTMGCSEPLEMLVTVYTSYGSPLKIPFYMIKKATPTPPPIVPGAEWELSLPSYSETFPGSNSSTPDCYSFIDPDTGKKTYVRFKDGADNPVVKFDFNGGNPKGNGTLEIVTEGGSQAPQNVTINFGGLTQYASSSTAFGEADGHAPGTLKSVSIDTAGVITGTYTNGLNVQEAQVAIAQFNNPAGLTKNGNSLYTESNNSGTPNVNTINALGCEVTPSALEMSNVDMANELTDMIVTQRGFQSNSKIITVSDELLETLINMKR